MDDARVEKGAEAGLFGDRLPPSAAAPREAAPSGCLGHRAGLRRTLVGGGPAVLMGHELLELVLLLALPRRRGDDRGGERAAAVFGIETHNQLVVGHGRQTSLRRGVL